MISSPSANMKRHVLEQVTDFSDFTRGKELKDCLKHSLNICLSNIRISPDGRHIHIIQQAPRNGLMTHDRYQRTDPIQCQEHLDLVLTRNVAIVDLLYFNDPQDGVILLGIIFENGNAELWKFSEWKSGWGLLQTWDLCNNLTVKITSVCISLNFIIWCEERPPSVSSPVSSMDYNTYCICKRTFDVDERGISLGEVNIILHNNPQYLLASTGDIVYLVPNNKEDLCTCATKIFLSWSPQNDVYKVHSASNGTLLIKNSIANKQLDFRTLVTECIGYLSTITPSDIYCFSPIGHGDILLLLSTGRVCLVQRDGILRHIYKLPDNCLIKCGNQNSLNMYGDVIALSVGRMLYLIDLKNGMELERIPLKGEGFLFMNCLETYSPHVFLETGLCVVIQKEIEAQSMPSGHHANNINLSSVLVEAVFEEACNYYQQRSLGTAQLTAEKLKKDGMFQAPIALADIIRNYLFNSTMKTTRKDSSRHEKLLSCLEYDLKSLIALEGIKTSMVKAAEKDLHNYCETLIQQELFRLLSSEIDRENLQYLNSIFQLFPNETWQAVQAVLQFKCNGEGSFFANAPAELWKIVLSPVQATPKYSNSQQKITPANGLLPVFELLCQSIFKFQPSWLPKFLELAQQQSGSSSTSSWSFGKEKSESMPLYKRALAVIPCKSTCQDLEVELLLCSQRPNAVMQALRMLIAQGQWDRVTQVAERYCRQSPILNKEIFTMLLSEVSQHRDLDHYLDLLWSLCPEDMTVHRILNLVLEKLPSTLQTSGPFQGHSQGSQLTIGLLKPLLSKVLQREKRSSQLYADILQSPTLPPPTPRRNVVALPNINTEQDIDLK